MMVWLASIAFTLLTGTYVLIPLFRESKGSRALGSAGESDLDRLQDRKTVVYRNLRDLEFEYKMGRLSDADFQQLEAGYKNEAADILQKLDSMRSSKRSEKGIKKDPSERPPMRSAADSKPESAEPRCPACGAEVFAGKKFCADCGHKL
jgi:hypothetical protein